MAEKHRRMYEQRHPETGVSAAQAEERGERLAFKEERQSLRRTGRNRGIIVPELPLSMRRKESIG